MICIQDIKSHFLGDLLSHGDLLTLDDLHRFMELGLPLDVDVDQHIIGC